MAQRNKVNVSAGPTVQAMSSKERHAARVAEIAKQQSELKREAAQRRAKREGEAAADGDASAAPREPVGEGA